MLFIIWLTNQWFDIINPLFQLGLFIIISLPFLRLSSLPLFPFMSGKITSFLQHISWSIDALIDWASLTFLLPNSHFSLSPLSWPLQSFPPLILLKSPFMCQFLPVNLLCLICVQGRTAQNHVAINCDLWWTGEADEDEEEEEEEEWGVGRQRAICHSSQQVAPLRAGSDGQRRHQVPQGARERRRGSGLAAVRGQPSVQGRPGPERVVRGAVPAQHTSALCMSPRHDTSAQVKHLFWTELGFKGLIFFLHLWAAIRHRGRVELRRSSKMNFH